MKNINIFVYYIEMSEKQQNDIDQFEGKRDWVKFEKKITKDIQDIIDDNESLTDFSVKTQVTKKLAVVTEFKQRKEIRPDNIIYDNEGKESIIVDAKYYENSKLNVQEVVKLIEDVMYTDSTKGLLIISKNTKLDRKTKEILWLNENIDVLNVNDPKYMSKLEKYLVLSKKNNINNNNCVSNNKQRKQKSFKIAPKYFKADIKRRLPNEYKQSKYKYYKGGLYLPEKKGKAPKFGCVYNTETGEITNIIDIPYFNDLNNTTSSINNVKYYKAGQFLPDKKGKAPKGGCYYNKTTKKVLQIKEVTNTPPSTPASSPSDLYIHQAMNNNYKPKLQKVQVHVKNPDKPKKIPKQSRAKRTRTKSIRPQKKDVNKNNKTFDFYKESQYISSINDAIYPKSYFPIGTNDTQVLELYKRIDISRSPMKNNDNIDVVKKNNTSRTPSVKKITKKSASNVKHKSSSSSYSSYSSVSSGGKFYKGGQFTPGGGRAPKGGGWY